LAAALFVRGFAAGFFAVLEDLDVVLRVPAAFAVPLLRDAGDLAGAALVLRELAALPVDVFAVPREVVFAVLRAAGLAAAVRELAGFAAALRELVLRDVAGFAVLLREDAALLVPLLAELALLVLERLALLLLGALVAVAAAAFI
jgi:hypothetical protein